MTGRMSGHHVLVTGGAQGIGAAIVRKALAEGGQVTAVDRNGAALDQFAELLGHPSNLCLLVADVTNATAVGTAMPPPSGLLAL